MACRVDRRTHACCLVGPSSPLHPACCSGLPLCFVARAFLCCECGKPVYRQGHVLRVGRLRGFRAWTDADHLELDSFAVEAFGATGRRASAPSLRPMPSCITTSSPRAAGKRPTRKSCAAGSVSKHCSCSAGRSSSSAAIRGWGQTYLPRASISRIKAMGLGSPELSFAMSLEESNGGLLTKSYYESSILPR